MPCAPRMSATLPATLQADRRGARRAWLRRRRWARARPCASSPARRCRRAPTPSSSRRTPRLRRRCVTRQRRRRRAAIIRPRGQDFTRRRGAAPRRDQARPARADACRGHEPCRAAGAPASRGSPSSPPAMRWCRPARRSARIRSSPRIQLALAALIEAHGGEPMQPRHRAGHAGEPRSRLARAGSAADILVTIGGASVGEQDLVSARARCRRAWSSTSGRSPCGRASP